MKAVIMLFVASILTITCFAQKVKVKTPTSKSVTSEVMYTCSMHPEVVTNKPGKCPKCEMDLTKAKTVYTCSMHPEVLSSAPGKCPKCEMDLTEMKRKTKVKKA